MVQATSVMVEHTFVEDAAFQAFDVELRVFPEQLRAIRTTTEVHVVVAKLQSDRVTQWFFSQAGRAYDQVDRFLKEFIRIGDE